MRFAIMGLVFLFVLGGAGAGAYFYFKQPAEAAVGETEAHKAAGEAGTNHGDGHAPTFEYVELPPLILPIVDNRGVSQTVSMVVMIQVTDSVAADKVRLLAPRLKDAYIQEMYGVLNKHASLRGGVVQVGAIKQELIAISHQVMGENVIEDVLLQAVQQRGI